MTERYPTRNGVSVSPLDIWLPETHLNPEKDKNYNNHHTQFYARMYGGFLLYRVFHDLAANQQYLPLDVHQWLHDRYGPPEMPTPIEAMNRIDQAYNERENLQIRKSGGYILRLLDLSTYQQCDQDYTKLNRR